MTEPGDRPPPGAAEPPARGGDGSAAGSDEPRMAWPDSRRATSPRWSLSAAIAVALGIGLVAASAWGLLRAILDLSTGLLGVAAVGGWAIGVALRQARTSPLVAMAIATGTWLLGLVLTWIVSMAILPGSSRTFAERIAATPFTDWLSPQFGLLEIAGLVVYLAAAGYAGRRRD